MSIFVGIDVSARTFDLAVRQAGENRPAERFAQTSTGIDQACRQLQSLVPERIVLEATGVYYLDLARALADADLPVSVINPRSARHFAELTLSTSKTDSRDAALLAEYAERMAPRPWTPPTLSRLRLRDLGRQINRLIASRTQAKNQLHALRSKQDTDPLLLEDAQEGIDALDRRIQRLSKAAQALIDADTDLARHCKHLKAGAGLGPASTIALLAELTVLPGHLKAPQVVRHAGLDVRVQQSGTSVNKPGRLSQGGNTYLRAGLFMPAMTAIRHDPRAKAFYDRLVKRGKKKRQAQCAVMRKYLTGIWACIQTNTPFDSRLLFSEVHETA